MKNFIETSIPNTILQRMDSLGFFWRTELSEGTMKSLIESMARFLATKKSKDKTVAVVVNDLTDHFKFCAYVSFIPQSEIGSDEGSFTINYSFDENDIDEKNMTIYHFSDPEMRVMFEDTAYIKEGVVWKFHEDDEDTRPCDASSTNINCIILDCIKGYMQANLNFDNQMIIPNYMTFTAEAESGGKVYISCEPSNVIKQFLKEDKSIGTVNAIAG